MTWLLRKTLIQQCNNREIYRMIFRIGCTTCIPIIIYIHELVYGCDLERDWGLKDHVEAELPLEGGGIYSMCYIPRIDRQGSRISDVIQPLKSIPESTKRHGILTHTFPG